MVGWSLDVILIVAVPQERVFRFLGSGSVFVLCDSVYTDVSRSWTGS